MSKRQLGESTGDAPHWRVSLAKAMQPSSDWADKDELLDVLYWGRQFASLLVGVLFGVIPLYGIFSVILYVALSALLGQHFVVNYQKVDEESLGGFWEIAKEGFGTAFATFLVSWITVYSALHFD